MRTSIRPLLLFIICFGLISCASNEKVVIQKDAPTYRKEPVQVSMLGNSPLRPYQVLGKTTISKFNDEGIKRQEATIKDLMRKDAAKLGGDAIIDLQNGNKKMTGTVIAYKQILV